MSAVKFCVVDNCWKIVCHGWVLQIFWKDIFVLKQDTDGLFTFPSFPDNCTESFVFYLDKFIVHASSNIRSCPLRALSLSSLVLKKISSRSCRTLQRQKTIMWMMITKKSLARHMQTQFLSAFSNRCRNKPRDAIVDQSIEQEINDWEHRVNYTNKHRVKQIRFNPDRMTNNCKINCHQKRQQAVNHKVRQVKWMINRCPVQQGAWK